MSMNLQVKAVADVTFKNGKKAVVTEKFDDLWQTPTEVTKKALQSKDPLKVYTKWVNEYAVPNSLKREHLRELEEWMLDYSDWEIVWFEL